jgi:hypothetical protein
VRPSNVVPVGYSVAQLQGLPVQIRNRARRAAFQALAEGSKRPNVVRGIRRCRKRSRVDNEFLAAGPKPILICDRLLRYLSRVLATMEVGLDLALKSQTE